MISSTVFFTWFQFSIAKSILLSNQPHFNYKLYQVVIIMGFWLYQKKGEKRQQELKSKKWKRKERKQKQTTNILQWW